MSGKEPTTAGGGNHGPSTGKTGAAAVGAVMTESSVSDLCKQNGGFRTPELNEQLHLHYKGYKRIEGLESFTEVKVLWLECNFLREIEGVGHMTKLSTLNLQQNMIGPTLFGESGLTKLVVPSLKFLNVQHNSLETLEGVADAFPNLEKLVASNNQLHSIEGVVALSKTLTVLDASNNGVHEGASVLAVIKELVHLCSLSLGGNPVVRSLKYYRKNVITSRASLSFLDETPVNSEERRCVNAWASGGKEAEAEERRLIEEEKQAWRDRQTEEFALHREQLREAAAQMTPGRSQVATAYYKTMEEEAGDSDDDANLYIPTTTVSYKGEVLGPTTVLKYRDAKTAHKAKHVDPAELLTLSDAPKTSTEQAVLSEEQLEVTQAETAQRIAETAGGPPTAGGGTDAALSDIVLPSVPEQELDVDEDPLSPVKEEDINVDNLRTIFKYYADEQQEPVPLMSIFGLQDLLEGTELLLGGEVDEFVTTVRPPTDKSIEWVDFLIIVEILSVVLFQNTDVGMPTPPLKSLTPLPQAVAEAVRESEDSAQVQAENDNKEEQRQEQIRSSRIVATVSTLIELLLPGVLRAKEQGNSPFRRIPEKE